MDCASRWPVRVEDSRRTGYTFRGSVRTARGNNRDNPGRLADAGAVVNSDDGFELEVQNAR